MMGSNNSRTATTEEARRKPRIRVVLPQRITRGQEQPIPETDDVENNSPDEPDGPQRSPVQTSASQGGRTSGIARWRRSPRTRVVLPQRITSGHEQPIPETDDVENNSPDEPDGPQRSPIQTSASPGRMSTAEVARRKPRIRVVLPQRITMTTCQEQPIPKTDEVKVNSPDELDGPQRSAIQTVSPNSSTGASNLAAVPSSSKQSPEAITVKHTFYPPIVLKRLGV